MSLLESVLLGFIQGVAEFLPISSSGHLFIARYLMGFGDIPILFDVLMHIPTLIAISIVFRKRIAELMVSLSRGIRRRNGPEDRENLRLLGVICVATVCTAIVGYGLAKLQDHLAMTPKVVSVLFLATAAILILSRFFKGSKLYGDIGIKEGVITGIAQGIGVLPGISRSGITISASLSAGMSRERAGEYSFLISIPAILGAVAFKIGDIEALAVDPLVLAAGLFTSFVVGLLSLLLLLRIVKRGRLYLFGLYLLPLGMLTLLFV
jgi:undecaprenyl-diphosphatase